MSNSVWDVLVVGAGQAGLTASYYLKKYELSHLVFERGQIAESWVSQRWHAFRLTSPNCYATLPGDKYTGDEPEVHQGAPSFAAYMNGYAQRNALPVRENATVVSVEYQDRIFYVTVSEGGVSTVYRSRQLIVASGSMNIIKYPTMSRSMPSYLHQLHAGEYRYPGQLPEGPVLVIGSAQSGTQIADDLNLSGRQVYLATSYVGRIPFIYRGKDIYHWVIDAGFFGVMIDKYGVSPDFNAPPSISLQRLASRGVTLLGKLESIDGEDCVFEQTVGEHIRYADDFSAKVKGIIDAYIFEHGLEAGGVDPDPNDAPNEGREWDDSPRVVNIREAGIRTVIWATGFGNDYTYIKLPVLTSEGFPKHWDGLSMVDGLYFPGLYGGSSIHGIGDNIRYIMERVMEVHRAGVMI